MVEMTLGEALHKAIPRGPHFVVGVRITKREFDEMPVATQADNLPVAPYVSCKVLIDGKWHACQRQYQFGVPIHYASPITIILGRA